MLSDELLKVSLLPCLVRWVLQVGRIVVDGMPMVAAAQTGVLLRDLRVLVRKILNAGTTPEHHEVSSGAPFLHPSLST